MIYKEYLIIILISITFTIISCESTCDSGYTEVTENGSTFCVPEYITGIEQNKSYGKYYYHDEFGLITYQNGQWYDSEGKELPKSEL